MEFVVELYASRAQAEAAGEQLADLRAAAEELTRSGTTVRFLRQVFVPEDETCLLFFEADSSDAVRAVARQAGVAYERVIQAEGWDQTTDPDQVG